MILPNLYSLEDIIPKVEEMSCLVWKPPDICCSPKEAGSHDARSG